jgi:hypothetical protein
VELLAYKASSDPDAMNYRHQEMRESDNKFVEAIQKESNAHYKVVTYKLQTYSNKPLLFTEWKKEKPSTGKLSKYKVGLNVLFYGNEQVQEVQ